VVVLGLRELVRRDGGAVAPELQRLLFALHEVAERQDEAKALARDNPESAPRARGAGFELETVSGACATVGEAASVLGCSSQWIRRLARRGVLHGHRVGRSWLIDRASLDDYWKRGRNDERSGAPGETEAERAVG
jgi:excisionase family DNA binding protein